MSPMPMATSTLSFPAQRTRWRADAVAERWSRWNPFSKEEKQTVYCRLVVFGYECE